ncbi:MAG TPA: outer membrane protein [Xanthobacteraceae bacterium]|jgi:outer membrane immunogenic protein
MRKALLPVIPLVMLTGAASAADLPYRSYAPPGPAGFNWMGPYLGGNLGYHHGHRGNAAAQSSGLAGGLQAGVNWQNGQLVFGGEADIQLSAANERFAAWKFSNPWFGTLRARAGVAFDNLLVYGTAGLAYGGGRLDLGGASESNVHYGWTAGLGLEIGLARGWSARAEYLFLGLAEKSYLLIGSRHGFDSNILRLGVNYRF